MSISYRSGARGLQKLLSLEHYNKQKWQSRQSPIAPLWGEIEVCAHWLFCMEFNAQQLLFEAFLDIMHIFDSVEP